MTYTELVEKARELGVAIQDTDEFTAFIVAKTAADKSEKLQDKLGQFNLKKLDLNRAIIAEEKDNEKIAELNGEVKNLYEAIVSDPLMIAYSTSRAAPMAITPTRSRNSPAAEIAPPAAAAIKAACRNERLKKRGCRNVADTAGPQ